MTQEERASMAAQASLFVAMIEHSEKSGTLQITLAAMASAMQMQLSLPRSPILHASALDDIMRAVTHVLEAPPGHRHYVLEKLGHGYECLKNWIKQDE